MANRRREERPGQPAPDRRGEPSRNKRRMPSIGGGVAATSPEARRRDMGSGSVGAGTQRSRRAPGSTQTNSNVTPNVRNQGSPQYYRGQQNTGTGHYGRGDQTPDGIPTAVLQNPSGPANPNWFQEFAMSVLPAAKAAFPAFGQGEALDMAREVFKTIPDRALSSWMHPEDRFRWQQNDFGRWYGGPAGINPAGIEPGYPIGTNPADTHFSAPLFSNGQQVFNTGSNMHYRYMDDPRTSKAFYQSDPVGYMNDLYGYGYDNHNFGLDILNQPTFLGEYGGGAPRPVDPSSGGYGRINRGGPPYDD
jgi:hypothetical protein